MSVIGELECFPFEPNRETLSIPLSCRIFYGEPVPTSPENALASPAQTVVVVFGGYVARRGVDAWRWEMVVSRRGALAEDTPTLFYEARAHLEQVRDFGTFSDEDAGPLASAYPVRTESGKRSDLGMKTG